MKYLDTKENSIEDSVTRVLMGEKLVGGQKKLDKDKDGDIDGKDFAMLRKAAAKKKNVKEGTWALPDTPKLKMGLKKALQRPIMLGKEGDDATDTIRNFIGDDELYDDLYDAGMKNPKGDARPIIKAAMKRLGIKEDVELDESMADLQKKLDKLYGPKITKGMADLQKKLDKLYGPKITKDIAMMLKDKKYKGNTSAFDAAVKKKYPKEYDTNAVQDLIRKHAEMNEQYNLDENFRKLAMKGMGTETKKDARVGLKTDYYLPSNGDKSFGKIMRVSSDGYEIEDEKTKKTYKFKFYDPMKAKQMKENYEIGNDYAKHTLRVTPGQSESDVDEMLGIMQKKSVSMREALAKVWGLDEGKSPFDKKEEKKEDKNSKKTMTGKEPTSVEVDPELNEGKIEKKKISERLGKNYKFNKNFLFDDKKDTPMSVFKTMGNRPGGADYNQTELADYLAQKSGKDFKDVYFDDIELVYVNKTVGTMKQPIAKLIDVLKKAR